MLFFYDIGAGLDFCYEKKPSQNPETVVLVLSFCEGLRSFNF